MISRYKYILLTDLSAEFPVEGVVVDNAAIAEHGPPSPLQALEITARLFLRC